MNDSAPNTFYNLSVTAQRIAENRHMSAKTEICAGYLESISNEEDLNLAVRFLGEGAFPSLSGRRISIGSQTISTCAAHFCEISYEQVFKPSKAALGSVSETIEKLMHNIKDARSKRNPRYLSLAQVAGIFEELRRASSRADKQKILKRAWTQMTSVEIKYFIRLIRRSSLQTGLEDQHIVSAIAKAFDKDEEAVRYVHMITGSFGETAVLSKKDRLDEAIFKFFHPLPLMLPSPVHNQEIKCFKEYIAEEKLDGVRCQTHISNGVAKLYSNKFNEVTDLFPEVTRFFLSRQLPDLVLDGVICVFRDDELLPSQLLKKHLGSTKPPQKLLEKYPVLFIAIDILFCDGQDFFHQPLTMRRQFLETISARYNLPVVNQFDVENKERLDFLLRRASNRGNDGLVLKDKNSAYEYGKRGKSWLKLENPAGTLDAVIMYAHTDSGRQNGSFSHFTLGICVKEDERYNEEFIPVGKISGTLISEEEMAWLSKRIEELAVEKYGPTLGLIPEIVVEAEFDDIQINKRTKANYTLRRPRLKTIRRGFPSRKVHTLKDVERMHRQKFEQNRLKQDEDPSFLFQKH